MEWSFVPFYGEFAFLSEWMTFGSLGFFALLFGFVGVPLYLWTALAFTGLIGFGVPGEFITGFLAVAAVFNIKPIRQHLISLPMMKIIQAMKLLPAISETEKAALDAGAVWVEADFFSGKPDFKKLMGQSYPKLTAEEQAYLDGPIEELCKEVNDWKIHQNKEIPPHIWEIMQRIRLFGMIIPKEYGGLEFSAAAHSAVIMKLASRSVPVTVTAMVPNSLGPAELLTHFGTQEQKDHYLPRLAKGEDIPCFALTEPRAGSDAGSLESNGELFKKDGELYVRLNWNKRWITLAGCSTVLGLAFELRDPDHLIGDKDIVGITCALIPSNSDGVQLGERHDPLGVPFYNCPTQGQNVEIPVSYIIGGIENAGKGWTMLMESLGAGRGISLPSQAVGGAKVIARVTSAHSSIRKQFGLALAKLEGLEEPLARIGGMTYLMDAMRLYTLGALDQGIKPSVITAIAKYQSTELSRQIINDGMDIMAGSGISRGPRNLIAHIYQALPIGITVEGANILTRTLIIFGQGLLRAHPWAYHEVNAIEKGDLKLFDKAIWGHAAHVFRALFRSVLLSLSRGRLAMVPVKGPLKRYAQKLMWTSASFALLSDIAMVVLGGGLKKKEKLTGRYADILSWMYICTAVMKRFEEEGSKKEDLPFVHFSLQYGLSEIQKNFDGILGNLKVPGLSWFFGGVLRAYSAMNPIAQNVSDVHTHKAAKALITPGESRERLASGIYVPKDPNEQLGRLENAFSVVKRAEEIEKRINQNVKKGKLPKKRVFKLIGQAKELGIINGEEEQILQDAASARWDACQVDSFTEEGYHGVEESDNKVFRKEGRENYVGPAGAPENYPHQAATNKKAS